jgi:hypothetical protein
MNKIRMIFGVMAVMLMLFPLATIAQETGASMNGTVRDVTGATVNNAIVVAINTATNARVTARTQNSGEYTLLKARTYSLSQLSANRYSAQS